MSGVWRPQGALTLETVCGLREGARAAVDGDTTVDLSAVTEADSAGLALLIELCRVARERAATLSVAAMPETLASLAALYGVSELIPSGE